MANVHFDPGQHLTKIKGQDYLEVKWRLAWLVSECPSYSLTTSIVSHENGRATVKATILIHADDDPGVDIRESTAHGSVTIDEFENYIEKAETKAIGRALAAIGYGTQFADDFDDTGAISDAPIGRQQQRDYNDQQRPQQQQQPRQRQQPQQGGGGDLATSAQKSMIQYRARQKQLEPDALVRYIKEQVGKEFNELTKREASQVIDSLA